MTVKVVVVGAGVIGLSAATLLRKKFGPDRLSVTLIADKFSPDTTSDKSGGFLEAYDGDFRPEDRERARKWISATFKRAEELYQSVDACEAGVSLIQGYHVSQGQQPEPWWKDLVIGYHVASEAEKKSVLRLKESPDQTAHVHVYATYIIRCRTYLPNLLKEFVDCGGAVEKKKIASFSELSSYDVIINCTGLGAAELTSDSKLYPAKGQIVLVRAPWIQQFVCGSWARDSTYVFPRPQSASEHEVLLGGTLYRNDWSETVDPTVTENILQRCRSFFPSLAKAEVLDSWAGLRPMREGGVRLEKQADSSSPVIVHCYGHGGEGVTMHWGCALEVCDVVSEILPNLEQ